MSNYIMVHIVVVMLFLFSACSLERRILLPPKLKEDNISKKLVSYRPIRKSGPAMFIEEVDDKLIVHNYGHGGAGCSLGPGAASYMIKKLDTKMKMQHRTKQEPITIIGAGIMGLFSAYWLIQLGYKNITIVADKFENLPSNIAGGIWAHFHLGDISKMRDVIAAIGTSSYKFYLDIAQNKNKTFMNGAKVMSSYYKYKETAGLDMFVGKLIKKPKKVIADFGNGNTKKMYVYDDTILINTPLIMLILGQVTKKYCKYRKAKIKSFNEIKDKTIINCSGYGAKKLCNDSDMLSVQGHLIVLKNQNPQDINYLLTIPVEKGTVNGFNVQRLYYIIPRHDPGTPADYIGVVGGTLVEGAEEGNENFEEFDKIIQRARNFYGIK